MDGGVLRRKYRRDRRPKMAIESPLSFYPKYAAEVVRSTAGMLSTYLQLRRLLKHTLQDPGRLEYTDQSLVV
jgi:hypothetical protein